MNVIFASCSTPPRVNLWVLLETALNLETGTTKMDLF